MSILFHCLWHNKNEWLRVIKKQFKGHKIYSLEDKPDLSSIEFAIIWDLSNEVLGKMKNVKVLFSLGAGADHILTLSNYKGQPIIRLKDFAMAERMTNHILSQLLFYQLNLKKYQEAQKKKKWIEDIEPILNCNMTIGVLGVGFLGSFVANQIKNLGYNVIGFKNSKPMKKYSFPVLYKKNNLKKFLHKSNVVVNMLPSTKETQHMINKFFLQAMKKKSLLINVGRGSTLNEKDLIIHLKRNKNFCVSLDVFEKEPLLKSHQLWKMPNVIITPHIASLTVIDTAVKYMYSKYCEYLKNGRIKNDINLQKGY